MLSRKTKTALALTLTVLLSAAPVSCNAPGGASNGTESMGGADASGGGSSGLVSHQSSASVAASASTAAASTEVQAANSTLPIDYAITSEDIAALQESEVLVDDDQDTLNSLAGH